MAANPGFLGTLDASSSEAGDARAQGTESHGAASGDSADAGSTGANSTDRPASDVLDSGHGANEQATATTAGAGDAAPAVVKQDTVPQGALHEARAQVRALKAQIAQIEAQPRLTAEDAALLRELREQRSAAASKQNEPPDFLSDPKGYVDSQVKAAREQAEAAKKEGEEARRAADEHRSRQDAYSKTAAAESIFVQSTPDYPQALEHIRAVQRQQLALAHPEATPEAINGHISFVEMQTAMAMLAQGRNPAEYAYEVAKTWGYKPPARPSQQQQATARVDKDAARSLGSGGSDGGDDVGDGNDGMQEFRTAKNERFVRRK